MAPVIDLGPRTRSRARWWSAKINNCRTWEPNQSTPWPNRNLSTRTSPCCRFLPTASTTTTSDQSNWALQRDDVSRTHRWWSRSDLCDECGEGVVLLGKLTCCPRGDICMRCTDLIWTHECCFFFGIWLWSLNQQTIWHEIANNFCKVHSDVKVCLEVSITDFKVEVLTQDV